VRARDRGGVERERRVSRGQNLALALLSVVATVVVLVEGGRSSSSEWLAAVAERKPMTVDAALPGAAAAPATASAAPSTDDAASGAAPTEDAVPDGAAAADEAPLAASPEETRGGEPEGAAPDEDEEPVPSKIEHVFLVVLAGHGFDATFGEGSAAPYLTQELRPKGALLEGYASLGRADLPDYLAMVGGQPLNDDTRAGCPTFREIPPSNAPTEAGVIEATGCVFPNTVATIGDQMTASGRSWRAYVEDLDKGSEGRITCRRPESNAPDDTLRARPGDGYATRHNPFVYYHSLVDLGDCLANDGPLDELEADLASIEETPSYSFIAPNLCNDGTESPCADGTPGGLARADAFLATWVPKILDSPAFKRDGLLIVAFAGSVEPPPQTEPVDTDGGVRNGALLVSPYAEPGSTAGADYDPYSLLRSIEDLFALRPLALAARARSFADTVLGDATRAIGR
jgi:hypothetical protein